MSLSKILVSLLLLLITLLTPLIYNSFTFGPESHTLITPESLIITNASQLPGILRNAPLSSDPIVQRLSKLIQFPSVYFSKTPETFEEMWNYITSEAFPELFGICNEIQNVAQKGKLVKCPAKESTSRPALLFTSHLDVVPISNPEKWTHGPFSGEIHDGYLYGRGTLDDKSGVMVILEALNILLTQEKWRNVNRDIYISVGFDEEIGGEHGAKQVTEYLLREKIAFDFVLDEGGYIVDTFPGMQQKVCLISVAEKGDLTLKLTVDADAGHSSMPKYPSAVGILGEALARLEKHRVPADFQRGVMLQLMRTVAPHSSNFFLRMIVANARYLGRLLEWQLSKKPQTDAAMRSTTAITMLNAGIKVNIIPSNATALVNFRLVPNDTVEDIIEHVRRVANDPRIQIEVYTGSTETGEVKHPQLASPVSCSDCEPFEIMRESAKVVFPDTIIAPYLFIAASDSKHYRLLSANAYGFIPYRIYEARRDFQRVHGVDERISLENYFEMVQFMYTLTKNLDHRL